MLCPVCNQAITENQNVQRIPAPQIVRRGPKSGELGLYADPNFSVDEEEIVHQECSMTFFDPEGNPNLYDQLRQEVEEMVGEEIREEERDRLKMKYGITEYDEAGDDPISCIFCKTHYGVWQKCDRKVVVMYCSTCGKYWDDNEQELVQTRAA